LKEKKNSLENTYASLQKGSFLADPVNSGLSLSTKLPNLTFPTFGSHLNVSRLLTRRTPWVFRRSRTALAKASGPSRRKTPRRPSGGLTPETQHAHIRKKTFQVDLRFVPSSKSEHDMSFKKQLRPVF
jgi:hypothetical protein